MAQPIEQALEVSADLDVDARQALVEKLEQQRGILAAWFPERAPEHHLTVRYDPEYFSLATLIEFIAEHRVRVRPVA